MLNYFEDTVIEIDRWISTGGKIHREPITSAIRTGWETETRVQSRDRAANSREAGNRSKNWH